jgi:uncharacterized repeat protein (TIGR03803 family)
MALKQLSRFAFACTALFAVALLPLGPGLAGATPTRSPAMLAQQAISPSARVALRHQKPVIPGCGLLQVQANARLRARCALLVRLGTMTGNHAVSTSGAPERVLYSFTGGADGGEPYSDFVQDASGALYGTAYYGGDSGSFCAYFCGVVFKLAPPAKGQTQWTESVIHAFTNADGDGANPISGLSVDEQGALYGTTQFGGANESGCGGLGCGTVYKLTPPRAGQPAWSETVLHSFSDMNGDGWDPVGKPFIDRRGFVYGTTFFGGNLPSTLVNPGYGVVFQLAPPALGQRVWKENLVHVFANAADGSTPDAGLVSDAHGNLYGTSYGGFGVGLSAGVVYELSPPDKGHMVWSFTVLRSFGGPPDANTPIQSPLVIAGNALYGVSFAGGTGVSGCYCGTVFKLTPPTRGQNVWAENILHVFNGTDGAFPVGQLLVDHGALFGPTDIGGATNAGTVFKLSPGAGGVWSFSKVHDFSGSPDGGRPNAGLTAGRSGVLFGTTRLGGAYGNGAVFDIGIVR